MERENSQNEYSSLSIKEALKLITTRFNSETLNLRGAKKIFQGINHIFRVFLLKKGQATSQRDSLKMNLDRLHLIAGQLNIEDKKIMKTLFDIIETLSQSEF